MSNRYLFASLLLAATLAGGGLGCRRISDMFEEKVVNKAADEAMNAVNVDIATGQTSVRSDDGTHKTEIGDGTKLPDEFPKQVPIYPGAKLKAATSDTSGPSRFMVSFSASEGTDKVVAFYKTQLKTFKVERESHAQEIGTSIEFVDKTEAKLKVTLAFPPDGAFVSIFTESL
jgi:hypothetical protein